MPPVTTYRSAYSSGLVTQGLLAHYKMNEGTGTTAFDYSGNGYHATLGNGGSAIPSWTAKGLNFFSNKLLALPITFWKSVRTMQIALNAPVAENNGQTIIGFDNAGGAQWIFLKVGNAQFLVAQEIATTASSTNWNRGDNILTVIYGTPFRFFVNAQECTYIYHGNYTQTSPSTSVWLGANQTLDFRGSMYYGLFYNRALSIQEINTNYQYLSSTLYPRGVTIGNSFAANSRQVLFQGDSLTEGIGADQSGEYPYKTMTSLTTVYPYSNIGQGGTTIATILAITGPQACDPVWKNYTGNSIYVLWAGRNDIATFGTSGAVVYANVVSRCNAAKAAGATKVILVNMLPGSDFNAFEETQRVACNTTYSNDSPTNVTGKVYTGASYCDYLIDVASETNLLNPSDLTYYQADGVHLTNAGYAIIAADVKAALLQAGLT